MKEERKKTQHRIRSLDNGIKRNSFNQMLKCRLTTKEKRIRNSFSFVLLFLFWRQNEKLLGYFKWDNASEMISLASRGT